MPTICTNCPRCDAKNSTFDVNGYNDFGFSQLQGEIRRYEIFSACRECKRATTFFIKQHKGAAKHMFNKADDVMKIQDSLNRYFEILRFVSLRDNITHRPPEFIPDNIRAVFEEGAACLSIECWNATGAMFRTCLDLASKDKIPQEDIKGLTKHHRENMGARIGWLFDNGILPENLRELADCVRHDGNDGAHDATLTENEAIDLLEFTTQILEHFYTQPEKAKESKRRRDERRGAHAKPAQPPKS